MKVKNLQARLIRIDGVFIAPDVEIEISDNAVGLARMLERGVLAKVEMEAKAKDKGKKEE